MNVKRSVFIYPFIVSLFILPCFYLPSYAQHEHHGTVLENTHSDIEISSYATHDHKDTVYHLTISEKNVNFTGKKRKAIDVNGQIPGPVLHFTEGDNAEIHVHNELATETSVHWHGLILPNWADGVPYLTTPPIKLNETFVYKFPLVQSGTYWYHSHTMHQEQIGLYGAVIIHKKTKRL